MSEPTTAATRLDRDGPAREGAAPGDAGPAATNAGPGHDRTRVPIGPILRFRGATGGRARLSVGFLVRHGAPPPVRVDGGPALTAETIGRIAGATAYDVALPPSEPGATRARLRLDGRPIGIALHGGEGPLRIAYTSCNGGEDEAAAARAPGGRNAMWTHLAERHAAEPHHLLIMGGDQIYADALWTLPAMSRWRARPVRERLAAPFDETMRAELEAHVLATYANAFGAPEIAHVLARVPSLMMWDDHDIVDGWGSRPDRWQACPVFRGLFATARRAFMLIQLGRPPDAAAEPRDDGQAGVGGDAEAGGKAGTGEAARDPGRADVAGVRGAEETAGRPNRRRAAPHLGWSGRYGPARLIVPDLRSGRTRMRVMAPDGRNWLAGELDDAPAPHLVLVSSVPLLDADLSVIERLVLPLQSVADLYQDDLRDQWMSYRHRAEWHDLVAALLERAGRGERVSVLSGEIHLGAHGTAEPADRDAVAAGGEAGEGTDGPRIEQFIASGVAHPPPPRVLAHLFEGCAPRRRILRRAGHRPVRLDMREVAPDGRRFVAERNWLEIALHPDGTRDAVLHAERSGPLRLAPAVPRRS